jgi:hypothetical protein
MFYNISPRIKSFARYQHLDPLNPLLDSINLFNIKWIEWKEASKSQIL